MADFSTPSFLTSPFFLGLCILVISFLFIGGFYGYLVYRAHQPILPTGPSGELIPLGSSSYQTDFLPDNESIAPFPRPLSSQNLSNTSLLPVVPGPAGAPLPR